jgi:hypothetical protein
VKQRLVITDAENFKNDMMLRDGVFPFGRKGNSKLSNQLKGLKGKHVMAAFLLSHSFTHVH